MKTLKVGDNIARAVLTLTTAREKDLRAKTIRAADILTARVADTVAEFAKQVISGKTGDKVRYLHDYYNADLGRRVPRYTQKHYQTGLLHNKTTVEKKSNKEYHIGANKSVEYADYIVALDRDEIGESHFERGIELTAPYLDEMAADVIKDVFD